MNVRPLLPAHFTMARDLLHLEQAFQKAAIGSPSLNLTAKWYEVYRELKQHQFGPHGTRELRPRQAPTSEHLLRLLVALTSVCADHEAESRVLPLPRICLPGFLEPDLTLLLLLCARTPCTAPQSGLGREPGPARLCCKPWCRCTRPRAN